MGYHVHQVDSAFYISAENAHQVYLAITDYELANTKHTSVPIQFNSLKDAMYKHNWNIEPNTDGSINDIEASFEKLYDQLNFLKAIASYVGVGSYIEMQGEDGAVWRWVFDGITCKEVWPKIIWPE